MSIVSPMKILSLMVCFLACISLGPFTFADDEDSGDSTREELLAIIRDLEERLRELERQFRILLDSGVGNGEEIAELNRKIDLLTRELEKQKLGEAADDGPPRSRYGLGPAASKVYGVHQGVSIGGYGEALLERFDSRQDDGTPSGAIDRFDFLRGVFYFGFKFNDRILFNSEVEFEHASTGESGEASMEFAYLDFRIQPAFNARAGLLLAPVGFINELHEPPVFLGARRPDVDRVILPTTWRENGFGAYGDFGPFTYRAYLLNGLRASGFTGSAGIRGGRQKGSKALAEDFALTGRLDWSVGSGLVLGGSFWIGDSGQEEISTVTNAPYPDGKVTLWDLHGEWKGKGWKLRGVYSRIAIDDSTEISIANGYNPADPTTFDRLVGKRLTGWYAEAGYDVLTSHRTEQAVIPFLRYEDYNTQEEVAGPFSADPKNAIEIFTIGLVYQPILQVSLKADFQNRDNAAGTATDQFNVAISYLF